VIQAISESRKNRKASRERGARYYWGIPCSKGHDTERTRRYTKSGNCVECTRKHRRKKPEALIDGGGYYLDQQAPRAYPVGPQPE